MPPVFDSSKVTVIFVLGGPGAGKGTQSAKLVDSYKFCHLSAGDLLRAEQVREGSEYGQLIRTCIREGTIVPSHVTIKLLQNAMTAVLAERSGSGDGWNDGRGRFLIDGFPRNIEQAKSFDDTICLSSLVLFYDTSEDVLIRRIIERSKTSGREDDNLESIKKRLRTYQKDTMPVIDEYKSKNKVKTIESSGSIEEIYEDTVKIIDKLFTPPSEIAN
ncbi:hypothetical protein AGABI1DRAFT_97858 [Agaricus bisporus var. burnettii JB137-S8]|uniref:Uridylate kinase n=1 Tax=Agaricus bisporus var. burnettii (strain JB137-S8 / ATCC MYA-4627 / FGSC 10392) TaxID=597362 RepID=K5XHJ3_AGABU|nr:uncharacterized protein AGABI1DRAFT_97858 [Agaricus bisporus var. burnettii JB137-S8]EKM82928.1 hypothetical protein AGABI1DRAFT_97858 [Agaricus bisporus var. burnettii JB137-S8]